MSKKIDITNYEEYALDYIEGTLSPELNEAFLSFLALNPEIAEELEEMREVEELDSSYALSQDFKDSLKVEVAPVGLINAENYEEVFAGSVDNELDVEVEATLPEFLAKNETLNADFELYQKSVLKADQSVVYPGRGELKQAIPLWDNARPVFMRVAAALVVVLGTITIWNAVQNEVYIPRNESLDFSLMDEPTPVEIEDAEVNYEETTSAEIAQVNTAPKETLQSSSPRKGMTRMKIANAVVSNSADPAPAINSRELIAYQPSVPKNLEPRNTSNQNAQELNLAQFVGKRFLGVEPEKTPTAGALIREGAIKAIDSRENVNLEDKENKRTIQFLAGNFEFKRVNYK